MYNPMDLNGKSILITGASSGIGAACAEELSRLGARIVLVGRNRERLDRVCLSLEGEGHSTYAIELTDIDAIPQWLKEVAKETGPLDGLVHSAGIVIVKPVRGMKLTEYTDLMRINLDAAIALTKGFRQKGVCSKPASIVFISSVAGMVGTPGLSAYTASKSALIGVTKSLAVEFARENIRVNSISPGYVETAMTGGEENIYTPEQAAALHASHPLGIGKPENVASAVAFLMAETGSWVTGTNLVVDGGRTCL